jgi:hypothetical protein
MLQFSLERVYRDKDGGFLQEIDIQNTNILLGETVSWAIKCSIDPNYRDSIPNDSVMHVQEMEIDLWSGSIDAPSDYSNETGEEFSASCKHLEKLLDIKDIYMIEQSGAVVLADITADGVATPTTNSHLWLLGPHEVKSLGIYTITLGYKYQWKRILQDPLSYVLGESSRSTTRFIFEVQNPLSIRTKLTPIPPFFDSQVRLSLELQVKNESHIKLQMESVQFDVDPTLAPWYSLVDFPVQFPIVMQQGDIYQYMFHFYPCTLNHGLTSSLSFPSFLGILSIEWRSMLHSSHGRLQTNPLSIRPSSTPIAISFPPSDPYNSISTTNLLSIISKSNWSFHFGIPFILQIETRPLGINGSQEYVVCLGPKNSQNIFLLGHKKQILKPPLHPLQLIAIPTDYENVSDALYKVHLQCFSMNILITEFLFDILVQSY